MNPPNFFSELGRKQRSKAAVLNVIFDWLLK
jgi:hypothetical protein